MNLPDLEGIKESKNLVVDNITFVKYLEFLIDNNKHICNKRSEYITDYYMTIDFVNNKYILPSNYRDISKCKGVYILPIRLVLDVDDYFHLNVIIIDNLRKVIDFYEPHGIQFSSNEPLHKLYNIQAHIDIVIRKYIGLNYRINNVHTECPRGLQSIQKEYLKTSTNSCIPLNLLMIATRVNNLNVNTGDIIKYFLKLTPKELDSYIRRWITYIKEISLKSVKTYKVIDEIDIRYSDKEVSKINKYIESELMEYLNLYESYKIYDVKINNILRFHKTPMFKQVFFSTINKYFTGLKI
jgi:hypothetical protein